jgi:hypothetical protein
VAQCRFEHRPQVLFVVDEQQSFTRHIQRLAPEPVSLLRVSREWSGDSLGDLAALSEAAHRFVEQGEGTPNEEGGERSMRFKIGHLAAAAAIAGFVGIGGVSLAAAQEGTTTTTTVQDDSTTTTAPDSTQPPERDCPERDGSSGSNDSGGSSNARGSSSTDADSL